MNEKKNLKGDVSPLASIDLLDRPSQERGAENDDLCEMCGKLLISTNATEEFFFRIWSVCLECAKEKY